MLPHLLFGAALILTVPLLILAEFSDRRIRIFVLKPLSTALVIATAVAGLHVAEPGRYGWLIIAGLCTSLGGDVALMFAKNRKAFSVGLALFLAAHLLYAAGFALLSGFGVPDAVCAVVLAGIGVALYVRFLPRLGALRGPVLIYIAIISLMVNRAFGMYFQTPAVATAVVCAGAALFYLSDVFLAWNRFAGAFRYNRISLAFYYAGQYLIALSVSFFSLN